MKEATGSRFWSEGIAFYTCDILYSWINNIIDICSMLLFYLWSNEVLFSYMYI